MRWIFFWSALGSGYWGPGWKGPLSVSLRRRGRDCAVSGVGRAEVHEEFLIVASACEAFADFLRGLGRELGVGGDHADHPSEEPDLSEGDIVEEELFAPGAAARDIYGGEDAALGEPAVQVEFHVACAFELLIHNVVQAAARIDEASRENGEAAAILDFAGGPEELAGWIEGDGVHAAGEGPTTGGNGEVVGAGEPGKAVEKDAHILAGLNESLGAFEDELGDLAVRLDGFVEGGTVDLSFNGPHHVGDLFGPFSDEGHHEMDVGGVGGHAVGDLFKDSGLAGLRRGYDHPALSAADGSDEVDESSGEFGPLVFEFDVLVR